MPIVLHCGSNHPEGRSDLFRLFGRIEGCLRGNLIRQRVCSLLAQFRRQTWDFPQGFRFLHKSVHVQRPNFFPVFPDFGFPVVWMQDKTWRCFCFRCFSSALALSIESASLASFKIHKSEGRRHLFASRITSCCVLRDTDNPALNLGVGIFFPCQQVTSQINYIATRSTIHFPVHTCRFFFD